jgi:hypothetical protein
MDELEVILYILVVKNGSDSPWSRASEIGVKQISLAFNALLGFIVHTVW